MSRCQKILEKKYRAFSQNQNDPNKNNRLCVHESHLTKTNTVNDQTVKIPGQDQSKKVNQRWNPKNILWNAFYISINAIVPPILEMFLNIFKEFYKHSPKIPG